MILDKISYELIVQLLPLNSSLESFSWCLKFTDNTFQC